MVEREQLQQLSKWAGFVGIMTIISGALSAIGGLFMFIVGAIPGVITIILGLKLRGAKRYADELLACSTEDETRINLLFMNLNTYFKIQGILIIVVLVFAIISFIMAILGSFAFMNTMPSQQFNIPQ